MPEVWPTFFLPLLFLWAAVDQPLPVGGVGQGAVGSAAAGAVL